MKISDFIRNNQPYFEDFISRATHHSNGIEGNTLSLAETYSILFQRDDVKVTVTPREFFEAINHKYALSYVMDCEDDLKQQDIIQIATLINKNIHEIKGYRTSQVMIRGAEHIPPPPEQIPQKMMYFLHSYHNTKFNNIFEKIAHHHIEFERIHPFPDGNGRTGRLLICHELIRNNVPPAIICKDQKQEYLNLLETMDAPGLALLLENLSLAEKARIDLFPAT